MDEQFYYLSAEQLIPSDAVYVIIGGSVTVVPPRAFEGHENLERVELQEGVQVIGAQAFFRCRFLTRVDWPGSLRAIGDRAFLRCWRLSEAVLREGVEEIGSEAFCDCINLTRVDCPSSLRTIGDQAFASCKRLSEAILHKGLEGIGSRMFCKCDLRRIDVPSSVVEIGDCAFYLCRRLLEAVLRDGLRRIGARAFYGCGLKRIAVPSSVVEIGEEAFAWCWRLSEMALAGGMVMLARNAYFNCRRLEQIAISYMAIVVEAGGDGNGRVAAVTGGIEHDRANEVCRLILASPHLESMRAKDLTNLREAVDRIVDTARGGGPLDLSVRDVSGRIRNCFVDRLSTWYKREVATALELGLWKIELGRAAAGGETAGADVPTRDECRCKCGVDPIVKLVLPFLGGPLGADRSENAGSIQP